MQSKKVIHNNTENYDLSQTYTRTHTHSHTRIPFSAHTHTHTHTPFTLVCSNRVKARMARLIEQTGVTDAEEAARLPAFAKEYKKRKDKWCL